MAWQVADLKSQLAELKAQHQAARDSLEQATGEKVSVLMRLSDAQQQHSRAAGDADALRRQLERAKAQLVEVSPCRSQLAFDIISCSLMD